MTDAYTSDAEFLGTFASFPEGPWILAALLECPVYLLFCMKDGHGYRLSIEPFMERIELPRATRKHSLGMLIQRYADRLGEIARAYPLQWYNFLRFLE